MVQTIAIECPSDGGMAVYQARAMLNYFYPDADYADYADYCEKLPVNFPAMRNEQVAKDKVNPSLNIFPNPANKFCTIVYSGLTENSVFNLTDVTGKIIKYITLTGSIGIVNLNTENFEAGVYLYFANGNNGKNLTGKLVLIK